MHGTTTAEVPAGEDDAPSSSPTPPDGITARSNGEALPHAEGRR
jgi:hypothetical protein